MASSGDIRAGRAFVELYVKDQALSRGLQAASNRLKSFASGIGTMGNLLMGSILTSRVMGMVHSFTQTGGAIAEMSARTGMAAETLSGLAYAASQTSVELEDVDTGVKRMQKQITEASRGNKEAAKSFDDMGLSFKDLMGKSPDEQFAMVGRAIAKIADPTLRAGSALTIFGRSGTKLLPMILEMDELTARAQKLGLVMGTEAAESAHMMERSLAELHSIATRTGQVIMEVLGQSIIDITRKFGEWAIAIKGFVSSHKEFANTLFQGATAVLAVAAALQIGSWALMFAAATFAKLAAIAGALTTVLRGLGTAFMFVASEFARGLIPAGSLYATGGMMAAGVAATAALVAGTVALVAVWANAEAKGISWGESVLDLTHRLTGLRNAYSDLQEMQARAKGPLGAATALRVAAGILPAQQTAAEKAGRPETPTEKAMAEARKEVVKLGEEIEKMDAARTAGRGHRMAVAREKSAPQIAAEHVKGILEASIAAAEAVQADKKSGLGFFKTLFGDPLATGQKIGSELWQGLQVGLKSRMGMMPALAVELSKIGAGAIEDPATREKAMARLDAEKAILDAKAKAAKLEADVVKERAKETPEGTAKAKELENEALLTRQSLADIELLRDAKLKAIDEIHARQQEQADFELAAQMAAEAAKEALRIKEGNEGLTDNLDRAKIEEKFRDDEAAKRKALLQLDWDQAKREAGKKGLDVGLINQTFAARMKAMEAVTSSTSVAGTFGSMAGMGMGSPDKQTADNTKRANGHLSKIERATIGFQKEMQGLVAALQFAP